jgi:GNAT superfamily N-acetyltransferase
METVEYQQGAFSISTDPARIDVDAVYDYLHNTAYWCLGRPREVVERSIEHSLSFGIYAGAEQAGYARVVTDYATFAWLCDVFVLEPYRGQGLGKWLVECVVKHPALQDLAIFVLATTDAHNLYRRYGNFEVLDRPDKWMRRVEQ